MSVLFLKNRKYVFAILIFVSFMMGHAKASDGLDSWFDGFNQRKTKTYEQFSQNQGPSFKKMINRVRAARNLIREGAQGLVKRFGRQMGAPKRRSNGMQRRYVEPRGGRIAR